MRCLLRIPVFLLLLAAGSLGAQGVRIVRYIPGDLRTNNRHLVVLHNSGSAPVNLSGWLLVTRDYSLRLPPGSRIAPGAPFLLVRQRSPEYPQPDLEFLRCPDFLIRFRDRRFEGNYVILWDNRMRPVDGFYYSPFVPPPFLPDRDSNIAADRRVTYFEVPPARNPLWGSLRVNDDPILAFEYLSGQWKLSSIRASQRPAASFHTFYLRYRDGVVSLHWATAEEDNCRSLIVERSEDAVNFTSLDTLPAAGNSRVMQQYEYYDPVPATGKQWFYRVRADGLAGNATLTVVQEIRSEEGAADFGLNAFWLEQGEGRALNVRFVSRYSQHVKIKLLDVRMRELAILYDGFVGADSRYLVKAGRSLEPGRYRILADTDSRRYWQEI